MKLAFILATLMLTGCSRTCEAEDRVPKDNGFSRVPETGAEARWAPEDLPFVIYIHPSAAMWTYHVWKAADVWNRRLGFTAFKVSEGYHVEALAFLESSPGIIPVMGYPRDPDCDSDETLPIDHCNPYTAFLVLKHTGKMIAAPVWMPNELPVALMPDAYLLLVHELGHVFGLDHDETIRGHKPWSIMEPALNVSRVSGDPPPITDADVERILDWYVRRKGNEWQTETTTTSTSAS